MSTAHSRGFCRGHYRQHRAGETLRRLQLQHHGLTEYDRFFKRVEMKSVHECWLWTGSTIKKGWHGQWRNSAGEIELAHRAVWRLLKGAIPEGLCVLHKCDNPSCVNPDHLFLGTHSDNFRDMWAKGRAKPGKPIGERHGMSKLTEAIIRTVRASSESGAALATRYGVTPTTICDIRKRRIWKHLGDY